MVQGVRREDRSLRRHGTSDATALASASAALIWSVHPDWTNNQVLRVMLNTIGGPTDGAKRNDAIGYGIVRPRIALTNPGDPGPADKYPLPDYPVAASASPTPSTGANPPSHDQASQGQPRAGGLHLQGRRWHLHPLVHDRRRRGHRSRHRHHRSSAAPKAGVSERGKSRQARAMCRK